MLALLVCGIISILFAVYGVNRFTTDYTCKLFSFTKWTKKWCMTLAWLPSACVVVLVLGLALLRSISMSV